MRAHEDRQNFLALLEDVPLVSVAAKRAGIAKSTIYRWRSESKKFAKNMDDALKRGRGTVNDAAESQLIKAIHKGDFRAVKYWLDNNKKEYARPRPKDFWEQIYLRDNTVTKIVIQPVKLKDMKKGTLGYRQWQEEQAAEKAVRKQVDITNQLKQSNDKKANNTKADGAGAAKAD